LPLQRDALTEAGCQRIFTEQMSGAVTDRRALHDALDSRSADTLIVWKLDRLARSMKQLIETIENLRVRGVGFRSLTEALETTTAQGAESDDEVARAFRDDDARVRRETGKKYVVKVHCDEGVATPSPPIGAQSSARVTAKRR
jgi:DNA invertase Pin-like site-specific DNA recombinase